MASKRAFGCVIKRGRRYLVRFRWDGRRLDRGSWSTKKQAESILRRIEDAHAEGVSLSAAMERVLGEGRALAPTWAEGKPRSAGTGTCAICTP